jgi:hypothetical protein
MRGLSSSGVVQRRLTTLADAVAVRTDAGERFLGFGADLTATGGVGGGRP